TTYLRENLQVETQSRGHKVIVDEPAELGGTDTGQNPVELLLSALGACQSIAARTYAHRFDIYIEDLRIELEGDIDLDGFLDKANVRPGFSDIRYRLYLKTYATEDKVKQLTEFIDKHCPVGDTVTNKVNLVSSGVVIENSQDTPAF